MGRDLLADIALKHLDDSVGQGIGEGRAEREDVFCTDHFRNASDVGAGGVCATAQSLGADQREAFVQTREHKDIGAVHECRHFLRTKIAKEVHVEPGCRHVSFDSRTQFAISGNQELDTSVKTLTYLPEKRSQHADILD